MVHLSECEACGDALKYPHCVYTSVIVHVIRLAGFVSLILSIGLMDSEVNIYKASRVASVRG